MAKWHGRMGLRACTTSDCLSTTEVTPVEVTSSKEVESLGVIEVAWLSVIHSKILWQSAAKFCLWFLLAPKVVWHVKEACNLISRGMGVLMRLFYCCCLRAVVGSGAETYFSDYEYWCLIIEFAKTIIIFHLFHEIDRYKDVAKRFKVLGC